MFLNGKGQKTFVNCKVPTEEVSWGQSENEQLKYESQSILAIIQASPLILMVGKVRPACAHLRPYLRPINSGRDGAGHRSAETDLGPGLCLFFSFFIQFLKDRLHLQLLQNTGSIPWVVQYLLVVYLTPNTLYLPLPTPTLLVSSSSFNYDLGDIRFRVESGQVLLEKERQIHVLNERGKLKGAQGERRDGRLRGFVSEVWIISPGTSKTGVSRLPL